MLDFYWNVSKRYINIEKKNIYIYILFFIFYSYFNNKEHLQKTYGIMEWEDDIDFLEQYALKTGKLLKKGDPDINAVGRMILNDWYILLLDIIIALPLTVINIIRIRGKIPYFVCPPDIEDFDQAPTEGAPTVLNKEEWEGRISYYLIFDSPPLPLHPLTLSVSFSFLSI